MLMSGEFDVAPVVDSVYEIECTPSTSPDSSTRGALSAAAPEMVRDSVTITVIPEPKRVLLQGLAALVVGVLRHRQRRGCGIPAK